WPPGGITTASLVYSAGNAFPFRLLYAADHSLFAVSIAALILSWAHATGAVNSTSKIAEGIACFIFMAFPPDLSTRCHCYINFNSPSICRTHEARPSRCSLYQLIAERNRLSGWKPKKGTAHALTDSGCRDYGEEACRFARGEASSPGSCTNRRFK